MWTWDVSPKVTPYQVEEVKFASHTMSPTSPGTADDKRPPEIGGSKLQSQGSGARGLLGVGQAEKG